MQRYVVSQFDDDTFVVIDNQEKREVCVCGNYDDWDDAEDRAKRITSLLNSQDVEKVRLDNFIFLTDEGYTFQPNSNPDYPDIENLQVIGF